MSRDDQISGDETGDTAGDEAIEEVSKIQLEPSSGFADRVMHEIQRRKFVNESVGVTWFAMTGFFAEFIQMLFGSFGVKDETRKEEE